MRTKFFPLALVGFCSSLLAAEPFPAFEAVTLDPEVGKVCYAVTLADVDGDGRQDVVAVTENRVLWYQAPSWTAHVIIEDQTPLDNVCIAPMDVDGDGKIDFALGAGWTKIGTIHWLSRGKSLDDRWTVHMIGEERWLHRMRWADVLGRGKPQLVISPLNATVGDGVRLTTFEVPANPATDRWPSTVLSSNLNRMHNHWHVDLDENGTVDTITASREGLTLIRRDGEGWSQVKIGTGIVADEPNSSGAGEIKVGKLKDGTVYLAAIEPMHGHTLSVYTKPAGQRESSVPSTGRGGDAESSQAQGMWQRHVIDSGFQRGHALWCADMDGDGDDEIVFGHSDTPEVPGVNIYDCTDAARMTWARHVIDAGGMATEDLIAADVTGDGRPDVVAGGRATHNLKLYVNRGTQ